jgi:hypothetical protein
MDCAVAGGDCAAGDAHTHQPDAAAVNWVVQAFANAPVDNPDGIQGINLHIDVDDAIAHQDFLNLGCFAGGAGIGSYDTVKGDANVFGANNPRRFAYRYAIFAHFQHPTSGSSGCGEVEGNDFLVTLAGFGFNFNGHVAHQAGTLMHEFGHNLGLRHGGDVNANYKPNYLSIMSYSFQFTGIPPNDPDGAGPLQGRMDYSDQVLPDLDENNLDEPDGVGNGADDTRYSCPNYNVRTAAASGAIEWNCDGDDTDLGLSHSINRDCVDINGSDACDAGEPPVLDVLTGYDDWANILYDFQNTNGYEDGDHSMLDKPDPDFVTATCVPDPLSQGYWHRQCLGVPAADGGIDPGRHGRGPQSPTEPEFVEELMPCADNRIENLGFYAVSTCEGMDAEPPSDPCERALKQLTATILNVCSSRLADVCPVDLLADGCESETLEEAMEEIAAMIHAGDCQQAASCSAAINEGHAIGTFGEVESVGGEPLRAPAADDGGSRPQTLRDLSQPARRRGR